jgi:hypothetical protein
LRQAGTEIFLQMGLDSHPGKTPTDLPVGQKTTTSINYQERDWFIPPL